VQRSVVKHVICNIFRADSYKLREEEFLNKISWASNRGSRSLELDFSL
jgi:hypothetical protein